MAVEEMKQTNELQLQAQLEQNNHQLVAIKQQLIQVERKNSTLKRKNTKSQVECRQCRQINL